MYNRQVNNVSPLSRELIIKLAKENDSELLREVLNYYAFLKNKKSRKPGKSGKALKKSSLIKKKLKSLMNLRKIVKNSSLSVWKKF